MRVCSVHFVDGRPTEQHPDPTLHIGYDAPPPHKYSKTEHRSGPSTPATLAAVQHSSVANVDESDRYPQMSVSISF